MRTMEEILDNLLFYDIEVFKEDSLVVFKNAEKEVVAIYHNDFEGLLDLIKGKTLVGFNNYFYDDYIISKMINQWSPYQLKELNDRIISGERQKASSLNSEIFSLDCFQQADVSMPSLKKIEANMGANIFESLIDFTIDRKLTEDELEDTIKYCSYDVDKTIDVFNLRRKSYFEPKLSIVQMLEPSLQVKAVRWNTTTISAHLVTGGRPIQQWSDIRLGEYNQEGEYDAFNLVPEEVKNFWKANYTKDKGKLTIQDFGCNIEFGFGGLHGVPISNQIEYRNVKLLDVASLYPNIIIKLDALGSRTGIYKDLVSKRLSIKHSDKTLSSALKLVINSIYGLLRSDYSLLKNKHGAISVCIYGQIILYDLCKRLSTTCQIININTDGVGFVTDSDDYKKVWEEWQDDYGFTLELDEYQKFIQKDVNNYIAVNSEGYVTSKGGDVGRYTGGNVFKNNSTRIVDIAVGEYLLNGTEVLDTILENLDKPVLFQKVLQAGRTYLGTFDENDVQYQKVNRVFPVKRNGVKLYKKRVDGGKVMFPDSPESMLVWNYELSELKDFNKVIDINYYYTLINKVLERWVV